MTSQPWIVDGEVLAERLTPGVLVGAAMQLGAAETEGLTGREAALLHQGDRGAVGSPAVHALRMKIQAGGDPLGDAFCSLRDPKQRRDAGAIYTPPTIVDAILDWASAGQAARVVDPGAGSGRFTLAAARRFPKVEVVAVELDPLATVLLRANVAAAGVSDRIRVIVGDYREATLGRTTGRSMFLGNPPYVRHHQIETSWKAWLSSTAASHGAEASRLAGLHVYFFLATLLQGQKGDRGAFITSAEWLDTNYGSLVRQLLLDGLGGQALHLLDPEVMPFEDATTTGAITCFEVGARPRSIRLRRVKETAALAGLRGGRPVSRERLVEARRWTPLLRTTPMVPEGFVELGDLCRVHRGAVTGSNQTWVKAANEAGLPESVLYPTVTRARELFSAGEALRLADRLRLVIDIPPELDLFDGDERRTIERFLRAAKRAGAADGYIAKHRRAWWSVGLREAAPILATYMARRPPAFVRNLVDARHINIAHGLYPRVELPVRALDRLSRALRESVSVAQGRTYAGGLTKFEPKEMERLPVPGMELLLR